MGLSTIDASEFYPVDREGEREDRSVRGLLLPGRDHPLPVPIASGHTLKLTAASAAASEAGPELAVVALTYQYRWGAAIPELSDDSDLVD